MNLKIFLATKEMTIKDFAEIVECTPEYISQIIHKRAYPSKRLARDILKATDGLVHLELRTKEIFNDRKSD